MSHRRHYFAIQNTGLAPAARGPTQRYKDKHLDKHQQETYSQVGDVALSRVLLVSSPPEHAGGRAAKQNALRQAQNLKKTQKKKQQTATNRALTAPSTPGVGNLLTDGSKI